MPVKWDRFQEAELRKELERLYVRQNRTIKEIADLLGMAQSTIYARLCRLGIESTPFRKTGYRNRTRVTIPGYSEMLAELVGILLGDGHISPTQVMVNLGSKEDGYVRHVTKLLGDAFGTPPHQSRRAGGYVDVYIGSVEAIRFLKEMGLCSHKVRQQVGIPRWIFDKQEYQRACLRGLLDTDGSIYRLRHGWQISFCNRSIPLLNDTREILNTLGFTPSRISGYNLYITKKRDIMQFAQEVSFAHPAKLKRLNLARVGTEVVKPGTL